MSRPKHISDERWKKDKIVVQMEDGDNISTPEIKAQEKFVNPKDGYIKGGLANIGDTFKQMFGGLANKAQYARHQERTYGITTKDIDNSVKDTGVYLPDAPGHGYGWNYPGRGYDQDKIKHENHTNSRGRSTHRTTKKYAHDVQLSSQPEAKVDKKEGNKTYYDLEK